MQEEPATPLPTHPVAKTLIENFCYLCPEEIPTGLPPKRDIQHHIDLIPSSIPPNKVAYRMSQRQVEELKSKSLIYESLCLCAVPALLVPKKNVEMHMCVDSRAIKKITIKYSIPYRDLKIC